MILSSVILLGLTGIIGASLLYFVSKKFETVEDIRIQLVQEALPGANCGGCGFPGCAGFAAACVSAASLEGLSCPVGGVECMKEIAVILGKGIFETAPMTAVVRCNGSCANRRRINRYDGTESCAIAASLYGGETGCSFGCFGYGDCCEACLFDAIRINPETMLPEIDEDKCTACGACVKACPKDIIELRLQGLKSRRIYVSCVNKEKGATAKKACDAACIGCGKCLNACAFDAITIENNLAYIDYNKCRLCRKCVTECPTNAIQETNFPPHNKGKSIVAAGNTL